MNRAINRQLSLWSVAALLCAAALTGCATVPPCEKPGATIYQNAVVFTNDEATKLFNMIIGLSEGKCRLVVEPDA